MSWLEVSRSILRFLLTSVIRYFDATQYATTLQSVSVCLSRSIRFARRNVLHGLHLEEPTAVQCSTFLQSVLKVDDREDPVPRQIHGSQAVRTVLIGVRYQGL